VVFAQGEEGDIPQDHRVMMFFVKNGVDSVYRVQPDAGK
jgi:hypothetical protein